MASARSLGTLTLDLILKAGGFITGLDKTQRETSKRFKQMGDSAEKFGRGLGNTLKGAAGHFLAFIGVTASVSAAIGSIKGAIDRADALRDFGIQLGVSAEAASKLSYAADQTGTSVESLSKSLIILSKNAALALNPKSKQAHLFEALLGPDYKKDLGNLETLIPKLSEAFNKLGESTAKTGVMTQLLGRNGAELKEFFALGIDGFEKMSDRATELGIVLSQDTLDSADAFKDKLGDLKAATGGFATEIASALLPQLTEIVDWAIDFVKEGGGAEDAVANLKDGFYDLTDAVSSVAGAGAGFIGYLGKVREEIKGTERQLGDAVLAIAEFYAVTDAQFKHVEDLKRKRAELFAPPGKQAQQREVVLPRVTVRGDLNEFAKQEAARIKEARALQDKINSYLGNPTGKSGGGAKKKTGKSDEQKEADEILKAYDRMLENLTQQKTLTGEVTELEKLRYELSHDEGAKFSETQRTTLENLAKEIDALDADNKLTEEAKQLTESLITPTEQINKERERAAELLAKGKISQEEYNKALTASLTPYEEVLANLREEIMLLGLSAEAQDAYLAKKAAGVEAGTPQGDEIDRLIRLREETAETTAAFNEFKDVTADLFSDVIQDSSKAGDALEEWGKRVLAIFAKIAAQKIIDKIFESQSNTAASGGGGFWANLFGSVAKAYGSGGGHATGGITNAGMMYPVGENGTEIYSEGGRDYLLTGSKGGMVTPGTNGVGRKLTQNFYTMGVETRRTTERKAQLAGREAQRAMTRNGR